MKFNLKNTRFIARQWMTRMNWNYGRGDITEFKFKNDGFGHVHRLIQTGGTRAIGFSEKRKFRLSIGLGPIKWIGTQSPVVKLHFLGHSVVIYSKGRFREV